MTNVICPPPITRRAVAAGTLAVIAAAGPLAAVPAHAASAEQLVANARRALDQLLASEPRARRVARRAVAVLVFPSVLKAGFVFGGETGNGVLFEHGRPVAFYNLTGGSWGLQIGGQDFSYALFFMNRGALDYLNRSAGFQVGTGPSIVVINKGAAAQADTTTLTQDVYAFPFNQKGLMAGLDIEGAKITRIHKH
ncbi:MAG: putative lipoprotein [Caulobacteraceae bacterium]|nr:putative lipoprotein [Caulobacteraceae bacterium]